MAQARIESGRPVPFFVLRGHKSEVQCIRFASLAMMPHEYKDFLLSGDADGMVIVWSMSTYRPLAIWRAHKAALLEITVTGNHVITHGRDNKLRQWEMIGWTHMDAILPLPQSDEDLDCYSAPSMICVLDVNALNFCQASIHCTDRCNKHCEKEILVVVPGLLGSEYLDIYTIPSAKRLATKIIGTPSQKGSHGSVMSTNLEYPFLVAGYEDGSVAIFEIDLSMNDRKTQRQDGAWKCLAVWTEHRDAVLGVLYVPTLKKVISCGIDARLVEYHFCGEIPCLCRVEAKVRIVETKHAGQQSLRIRSDQKLLVSGGWDSFARIYTAEKLKQVAVLGFHKTVINTVDFARKLEGEVGIVAVGSKDSKISLWKVF